MSKPHGIILAGGDSLRFAGATGLHKSLAPIADAPLILHVAAMLVRGGAGAITVLTGAAHAAICAGLGTGQLQVRGHAPTHITLRQSAPDLGTAGRLATLPAAMLGEGALLAYTDVLSDAPLADLLALRRSRQAALAMLAVQPDMPWGIARLQGDKITDFTEKPPLDRGWVNGGIFAVSAAILPHIHAPHEMLEREPMARLIAAEQAVALRHRGIWRAVDTTKDHARLNDDLARAALDGIADARPRLI
ncbi:hypothetical protein FTO60_05850 [Octadecabacter sp. SW4]|uniref:sugar phosphate nucleotidyltransferase n=1 Tax=Octadecabacter sp. SW4 TaxID=2602067 RepID=UPI0011C1DDB8|nr:sugar phosphate nucleotidyltransferase [Octadecabacter sp. SW4]QEE35277.1 hypothetical protein FTO60_05850 [Octadecabacter sp. SW4]